MESMQDAMFHVGQAIYRQLLLSPVAPVSKTESLSVMIDRIEAVRHGYACRMAPDLFDGFPAPACRPRARMSRD